MRRRDHVFHCPTCDATRVGEGVVPPLGDEPLLLLGGGEDVREAVTCVGCRARHRLTPRRHDGDEYRQRLTLAARAMAASVLLAGPFDDPASIHAALEFVRLYDDTYGHLDLARDLGEPGLGAILRGELTLLGRTLTEDACIELVRQARRIADAGPAPTRAQRIVLTSIASHLLVMR